LAVVAGAAFDMRRRAVAEAGQVALDVVEDGEYFIKRVSDDERLAHLPVDALDAASRTALKEKRRVLGMAVGKAVRDDAEVDTSDLVVGALRDLDAVHFQLLAELEAISEKHNLSGDTQLIAEDTKTASDQYPTPVRAALIRHGAVDPATVLNGGTAIARITTFGRDLLADVEEARTAIDQE
jgi:hypothetical protein